MTEELDQIGGGTKKSSNSASLVSVIVPSRNSENTIVDCLESIVSQTYWPIEVIVVDNDSTDSTREIAKRMGAIVATQSGGRSVQKNLGAKLAKGRYLYFVDADFRIEPKFVADCVEDITEIDGLAVINQDLVKDTLVSRLVASRREIAALDAMNVAVRFVRKDAFDHLNGFDPHLYAGEDLDLHQRFVDQGFRFRFSRGKDWHLGSPSNWKDLINHSLYYSSNYSRYAARYPWLTIKRSSPIWTVAAWKRCDSRRPSLFPVILLGLFLETIAMFGVLLSLGPRETSD